jgi:putative nucleotidyltransferase with HDIG domain
MNRAEAFALLNEYTKKEGLVKHALAVEAAMRAYAAKAGGDVEAWGIVGLLHDFDYERYPSAEAGHPFKGAAILREKGVPAEWVDAVLGHGNYTGVKRETAMAKTLFAVDELAGFVVAVALVRPDRKLEGVSVQSVRKKMKDKAFAASVSREDIVKGAEELGVPLDAHIDFVLSAMRKAAPELGL